MASPPKSHSFFKRFGDEYGRVAELKEKSLSICIGSDLFNFSGVSV